MELYRNIIEELKTWKRNPGRKPLILKGARQTGKTWILEYFGRTEFKYTVKFNFDKETFLINPSQFIVFDIMITFFLFTVTHYSNNFI